MIDWDRFAARVKAGTLLQAGLHPLIFWTGILLENYPYAELEAVRSIRDYERIVEHILRMPRLRYQAFRYSHESTFELTRPGIYFLIDGRWTSFDEIMG